MGATPLIILAAVLLAGCANLRGYEKPGVTEAQFKQDVTQCDQKSEVYDLGIVAGIKSHFIPAEPDLKAKVIHNQKAYRECMLSRGYKESGWNPFR